MGKKAWKRKILAGILCASLVFQSVSVTSFAEESTQEIQTEEAADNTASESDETEASQQQETEQEPETVAETETQEKQTESTPETSSASEESTVASEGSTEAAADETTEAETETETATTEEAAEESTVAELEADGEERKFEDVQIEFSGFKAYVKLAKLKQDASDQNCSFYLVQYKGDQKINESYVTEYTSDGYYVCNGVDVNLFAGVDKVVLEARISDISYDSSTIISDPIVRTNQVTDLNFDAKDVTTGSGSLKLNLSYTGDMKIRENSYQSCTVYLYYGTDTNDKNWNSESRSVTL